MMKVTQTLTNEHYLILKVLQLLNQSRKELESGKIIPGIFFEKAMAFCSDFADQFHHFKEEFLLFGLLSYKKEGELDSAMGTLRYQHERCKHCISQIKKALDGYNNKKEMSVTFLLESLAVYVSLLRRHIYLEDQIFFPMAEKALSTAEKKSLQEQFADEENRLGSKESIFERNQILADELAMIMNSR
ncbi:MAG: hypothetical protein GY699_18500 [Desulfobacteraceae bacterium]|nr:hypothetical protein [Desulfobacteraceae bacterium]